MYVYDTDATHCVLNTTIINQQRKEKMHSSVRNSLQLFSESTGLSFAVHIHQSRTKKKKGWYANGSIFQNNEQSEEINKANNSRGWLD